MQFLKFAFNFTYILGLVFAVVSAFPPSSSETLHKLDKRATVCSLDPRLLVKKESCLPKGKGYFLQGTSAVQEKPVTNINQASKLQCDHNIELQLLNFVFLNSGLCKVATAYTATANSSVASDRTVTKGNFLDPAIQTISNIQNLNFLEDKVNGQKKTVVSNSFNGKAPPKKPSNLDKAVADYLTQTEGESLSVATQLDADAANILTTASTRAAGMASGNPKRKALEDAIRQYDKSRSVKKVWNKVLDDAKKIQAS